MVMHPGKGIGFRKILEIEAQKRAHKKRKEAPRTRSQVNQAVASYLERGGEITKLPEEPAIDLLKEDLWRKAISFIS